MLSIIPDPITYLPLISQIRDTDTRVSRGAKYTLSIVAMRISIAAGICFAAYKGYMLVAAGLATFSLPATSLAAGAFLLKYGYTALKAGIIAKQISFIAQGLAALLVGWKVLDLWTWKIIGLLDREIWHRNNEGKSHREVGVIQNLAALLMQL